MPLQIHRAERADRLVDALAALLDDPLEDPFATEIVAVPTQGVERWLAQRLSHRLGATPGSGDGICAGIEFPSLRRLVARALGYGGDRSAESGDADPWRADRAVWALLAVVDDCRGEDWAALLWHYLRGPTAGDESATSGRRWRTARRLAELFARYAADRPAMIRHWAAGRDLDATGVPLPADRAWQAELWRRLRDRLGVASPPDRLAGALAALAADPAAVALPDRLSIFGATRLDTDHRAVIGVLAEHREVHLWLPHPSPALWDAMAAELTRQPVVLGPRAADPTAGLGRNRLLGYLGRDSRELQLALYAGPVTTDRHYPSPAALDRSAPTNLLQQLQRDLAADADPDPTPPPLRPSDRSVQVHACYGPDRQVEVLREVLVGLLADDPTLEPRDIVVMCPDIERFAPLISAAFGLDTDEDRAEHPGHRLRVRLADRALRQLNPLLAVLSRVLDLADARMTGSDVLDLAAFTPVARKFGFSEDDTERLRQLVRQSGVRWGLDSAHRAGYGMEAFGQNTWAAGLDRLLLGVAMDEDGDHFIGTALPLDDVDSSDVDLIGRLAELVRRLERYVDAATTRHDVPGWVGFGRDVIDGLTATTMSESWQINHAYAELARLGDADDQPDVTLTLAEVRALLGDTFRGRPSRANFRTGTLTMCTMHPMRSVPHRVVCLLGVDDGVFPRRPAPNGDDLMESAAWIGDRDPRSEDRQLLLDAVLAAEEHLVVIYGGADPRTGATRPPAVPIGALLDALDRTVASPDQRLVRDHLTRRHPLQPFDPVNFTLPIDHAATEEPFSFDRAALRGALVAVQPRRTPEPATGLVRLPPTDRDPAVAAIIDLTEIVRFFAHPARALLRTRGIWLGGGGEDDTGADQLAVELDGLASWAIGERLLERRLRGAELDQLRAAEWRRGSLPPQAFGNAALNQVLAGVAEVGELAQPFLTGDPVSRDVRVPVGEQWVAGTLQPLYPSDEPGLGTLLAVSYSRLAPKHRLASWLRLLALTAGCPEQRWRAVTIGRGARSILGPVDPDWALRVLADLVQLYGTGLDEPVPFAPRTSAEYALIRFRDQSVENLRPKIERVWEQERDEAWAAFLGPEPALDTLRAEPSRPAEERGTLVEPSRFGTLARRVFSPLLMKEDLT